MGKLEPVWPPEEPASFRVAPEPTLRVPPEVALLAVKVDKSRVPPVTDRSPAIFKLLVTGLIEPLELIVKLFKA